MFAEAGLVSAPYPRGSACARLADALGAHAFGRTIVVGVAAPFGDIDSAAFSALIGHAHRAGAAGLRLAPWRTLFLTGVTPRGAASLVKEAAKLGFILDAGDRRLRVASCPGAPACLHGVRPGLRDDAARWARLLPAGEGVILHVERLRQGLRPAGPDRRHAGRDRSGLRSRPRRQGGRRSRRDRSRRPRGRRAASGAGRPMVSAEADRVTRTYEYEKDGAAIYRRSFAIIRGEAKLSRFSPLEERVAVRVIHACGMVEAADDLVFSPGAAEAAERALKAGATIFCDARMVAEGVTRARLPAANDVVCTLADPATPELARTLGTTRTAAAIDLWLPRLGGAVVAIGNAPTALFRLIELIAAGAPRPAVVIGMPVGFVGAAESKEALIASGLPAIVVSGRKGGSAMAAAAVNALASEAE